MSDLTPYESIDLSKMDLSKIDSSEIRPESKIYTPDYKNIPYRNPNEKLERLTKEQTSEFHKILYENMKLNAQIEVLNKSIDLKDSRNEELININVQLKANNEMLKKSNRFYWIKTIAISLGITIFGYYIGKYGFDIKPLLSILVP